jgi:hypothetical protein
MQNLRRVLGKLVNGDFASGIVVGIVGAAATVWLTSSAEERQEVRRAKMEVLRKIAANRCALAEPNPMSEMKIPMAEALNEAFVVFNDSPHVVAALANFRRASAPSNAVGQGAELQANKNVYFFDAIRAMSSDVGVTISDQREIEVPFCIGR